MNTLMPNEIEQRRIQATLFDEAKDIPKEVWKAGERVLPKLIPKLPSQPFPDITANYHKGNPQSVAANHRVDKVSQTKRVREALAFLKGATCEEVENNTGLPHQSVSARMSELKRAGLIVKIGLRKTSSGCNAGVWKIK